MPRAVVTLSVGLMLASCGGGSSGGAPAPAPFTCAIGELTGAWLVHYVETNGNCGPLNDETVLAGVPQTSSGCTVQSQQISTDKCTLDIQATCPTTDGLGTQTWVDALHQVSSTKLTGTGTVQVNHPTLGICRSTYNITITQK
jgi:hypothetical protein